MQHTTSEASRRLDALHLVVVQPTLCVEIDENQSISYYAELLIYASL